MPTGTSVEATNFGGRIHQFYVAPVWAKWSNRGDTNVPAPVERCGFTGGEVTLLARNGGETVGVGVEHQIQTVRDA